MRAAERDSRDRETRAACVSRGATHANGAEPVSTLPESVEATAAFVPETQACDLERAVDQALVRVVERLAAGPGVVILEVSDEGTVFYERHTAGRIEVTHSREIAQAWCAEISDPACANGGDPLGGWPTFAEAVRKRLEQGRATYHDESFDREPADLLQELAQEALDLAGWGFVLWARVQRLATKVEPRDG